MAVELDGSWGINGKLHGGYLLATVIGEAMAVCDPDTAPHPVAASALFVTPPQAGAAEVEVQLLRAGRSVHTVEATLVQGGRLCVRVLLTAGRLQPVDVAAQWSQDEWPPELPPPDSCVRMIAEPPGGGRIGHLDHVELRMPKEDLGWAFGRPSGGGRFSAWGRLEGWDPLLATYVLADAMPPVTFDIGLTGWVPTLQFQVALRRLPMAGWFRLRQSARLISGGLLDEDCDLWDDAGRLIAQARQIAAYRE